MHSCASIFIAHIRYNFRLLLTDATTGYALEYDAGDRLTREVRPDGVERHLRYDDAGELVELEKIGAQSSTMRECPHRIVYFERDKMGRLLAQISATSIAAYAWNNADRLVTASRTPTDAGNALGVTASHVSFDYDKAGRLIAEHGAEGTVAYSLDELDNIASLDLPYEQRIDMLAYGSGHVHQIRMADHVISNIERDDLHREILRTQGRLTQRTGYDLLGRRSWQSAGTHAEMLGPGRGRLWRSYRYTRLGELAEQNDSVRGSIDYHYDPAGRLLRQYRTTDQLQEQFVWDAAGNLLDVSGNKSRGLIEGNRLKVWQDLRFEYDPWGNLSYKRKGSRLAQRFTFDAEDRLISVSTETAQGVIETSFEYDPIGRRIASSEIRRDVFGTREAQRKRFVWQGLCMVQEVRDRGVSNYIYSPDEAYVPLARVDAFIVSAIAGAAIGQARETSRVYHFHTNVAGTPMEVTDEAGELAWAGKYSAWGKVEHGEDAVLIERIHQPLRHPGQYADEKTGLHYNTFRFFDPETGRFISQDPIGLSGGLNLYSYAPNSTGWIDPLGWAALGQLGTYADLNSGIHVGDSLQAHELIRHEYLQQMGLAGDSRLGGNPSIALDLDRHTRGPLRDSRGIGGAHYHEAKIRKTYGLGPNEFHTRTKVELDITQGGLRKAGIPASQARRLRKQSNNFLKKLKTGC